MLRVVVIALSITASAAQAQTAGGPPIGYVKRVSNGDEIHLVGSDNTGLMRIYKAPSKVQITHFDLRPGGGEVAFLEGYYKLRILAFDDYGRPLAGYPRTIETVSSPCSLHSPDYHPAANNGTLLFVQGCGRDTSVRIVQRGAQQADSKPLFVNTGKIAISRARWSRTGDALFLIALRDGAGTSDPNYLHRHSFANSATEEHGPIDNWTTFDVARVGEKVYWGSESNFKLLDFASGATTADAVSLSCPLGSRMSRSPDDRQMVFVSPQTRGKGNYVMLGETQCPDGAGALTGAGTWGPTDWRM